MLDFLSLSFLTGGGILLDYSTLKKHLRMKYLPIFANCLSRNYKLKTQQLTLTSTSRANMLKTICSPISCIWFDGVPGLEVSLEAVEWVCWCCCCCCSKANILMAMSCNKRCWPTGQGWCDNRHLNSQRSNELIWGKVSMPIFVKSLVEAESEGIQNGETMEIGK